MSLGREVHKHLVNIGIETPMKGLSDGPMRHYVEENLKRVLQDLNLDLQDDSLSKTPARVAKMYCDEVFWGLNYTNFPECSCIENKMHYDEMVSQRCSVMSMCEHHLVPFTGIAHVGYLPKTKVIGLSKINRVVDFFSRRPQVQERLTAQICATLSLILETEDVACVIQAEHMCVKLRGIKDELSHTTTSKMGGRFMSNPALREEFLALSRNNHASR